MTVSGTYNFNPTAGSLALAAFGRIQVYRPMLDAQHMENAYLESNLMQSSWGADGMLFFNLGLVTVSAPQGQQVYTVPSNVINVLDVYINDGSENILLFPFSRTDFASLAEPQQQGRPTSFWNSRVVPQTLSLWPVPDNAAIYTLNYYVQTQSQDINYQQGGNPALPNYWLDAYVADLSHRLSRYHKPELEEQRKKDRDEAYAIACKQVENTPMYINPGLAGYFRP